MIINKDMRFKRGLLSATSDTHINHDKDWIWGRRGFASLMAHLQGMIDGWNSVVPTDGQVIHCGDLALTDPDGAITKDFLSAVNGHIYFVNGNHPSGVKALYRQALAAHNFPNNVEVYPLTWNNKLTFVGDMFQFTVGSQVIIASHFPYLTWNNKKDGVWHISGHEHGQLTESLPDWKNDKRLDVGVDVLNHNRPFTYDEIEAIMATKVVTHVGHH